uniref:CPG4 domain-containing protein n=2 Tax=Caenorhabditis japonica TaxID=281687 RepID=A0A8R1HJ26_CAEJA
MVPIKTMRALFLSSLLFFTVANGAVEPANADKDSLPQEDQMLDVDTIFRAMGVPYCMRKCIDPFINSTTSLWYMKDVVSQARQVCTLHAQAITCLKNDQFCDHNKIFVKASSSVQYMCATKHVLFERMEKCLNPVVDDVMSICDKQCYSRSNLTAFSQDSNVKFAATVGGNAFIVADHLGPLCSSLQCTLPCVTKKLNSKCALSGWLSLDMLMQPFDAVAVMIDQLSVPLKDLITKKIDKQCRFAVNPTRLNRIRNGDFSAFNMDNL